MGYQKHNTMAKANTMKVILNRIVFNFHQGDVIYYPTASAGQYRYEVWRLGTIASIGDATHNPNKTNAAGLLKYILPLNLPPMRSKLEIERDQWIALALSSVKPSIDRINDLYERPE